MNIINKILSQSIDKSFKIKTENLHLNVIIKKLPKGYTWEAIDCKNLTSPPLYPMYEDGKCIYLTTEKLIKRNLIRRFIDKNYTFGIIEEGLKTCNQCKKSKQLKFFHKNSDICRMCYYSIRLEIAKLEEQGKSKCIRCGKIDVFKEFRKNKSTTRIGVSPICLKCQNKEQKKWKEKK